jgi:hypothetical protein
MMTSVGEVFCDDRHGCLFVDPLVTIVLHSDAGAREGDPFRVMETHSSLASRDCELSQWSRSREEYILYI